MDKPKIADASTVRSVLNDIHFLLDHAERIKGILPERMDIDEVIEHATTAYTTGYAQATKDLLSNLESWANAEKPWKHVTGLDPEIEEAVSRVANNLYRGNN